MGALIVGSNLALIGCGSPTQDEASPAASTDSISVSAAERDSALAVLDSMHRTAFDSAFAALANYAFTRYLRTEQMTPAGTTTAVRSYTVRFPSTAERGTIQRRDSVGTFRKGGMLTSIAPNQSPTTRPVNLAPEAVPDQPAYLEPRTQEAFRYALRSDTLIDGTPVIVVRIQARSGAEGYDQSIQRARLTIDRASRELVGVSIERSGRALVFSEDSRLSIQLRRGPDDTWVPHFTRFRAALNIPFRATRQFQTVSAYYDITP